MIQFINVTKEYKNGVVGLKDINLKIEDGEFVFLVGASGAGKSTFTKLMIREISPTTGSILIDGKGIHRLKQREIPIFRRNMGFVFQDFRLLSDRTAFENVAFAMEALGASKKEVERKVYYALDQVGLRDRADHFPNELSGGEQQRVAIARAIVNHPKILVADEPTGNLDVDTAKEIMEILYDVNRRGTTVLMATHDRGIVEKSYHRILTLSNGSLIGDDNLMAGYYLGRSDVSRKTEEYIPQRIIAQPYEQEEYTDEEISFQETMYFQTYVGEEESFVQNQLFATQESFEKYDVKKEQKSKNNRKLGAMVRNKMKESTLVDAPKENNPRDYEYEVEKTQPTNVQYKEEVVAVKSQPTNTVSAESISLAGSKAGSDQSIGELERKVLEAFYGDNE